MSAREDLVAAAMLRDATVVQDELHVGTLPGQLRRQRNLPGEDAEVKREFVLFEQADVREAKQDRGQLIRFDVNPPEAHEVRREHRLDIGRESAASSGAAIGVTPLTKDPGTLASGTMKRVSSCQWGSSAPDSMDNCLRSLP